MTGHTLFKNIMFLYLVNQREIQTPGWFNILPHWAIFPLQWPCSFRLFLMLSFVIFCCINVIPATFGCGLCVLGYFLLHHCPRKSEHSIKAPEFSDKRGLVNWPLCRKA